MRLVYPLLQVPLAKQGEPKTGKSAHSQSCGEIDNSFTLPLQSASGILSGEL